jgi:hypothetical protein
MKRLLMSLIPWITLLNFSVHSTIEQTSTLPKRKIVALVSSYNNTIGVTEQCLRSILMQDYPNFEVLFCDDCSPQANIEEIHKALIERIDHKHQITYRHNNQRYRPMGNQWHAWNSINPENREDNQEIIVVNVDGDDVLLHNNVFTIINELHHKGAWVTWGQCLFYPSMQQITACQNVPEETIVHNKWRDIPFCFGHIRTYRLSLLKNIPLQSVLYNGDFYPAAGDVALMWHLCEEAGKHAVFNSEPCYGYRVTNQGEAALCPKTSSECMVHAQKQPKRKPLDKLPVQKSVDSLTAELIIFSYKRPMQLYAHLESLKKYVTGFNSVTVLYRADDKQYQNAYNELKEKFNDVSFVQEGSIQQHQDFKSLLLRLLTTSTNDYIMFATDDNFVKDYVSIRDCMQALQKTHAYGFYLRLGTNLTHSYMANSSQEVPHLIDIGSGMLAWEIDQKKYPQFYDWSYPNTVDMTLFPKDQIIHTISKLNFNNPTSFEGSWASLELYKSKKIGLCFAQSKVVNIPQNKVQTTSPVNRSMKGEAEQLQTIFESGLKIDISPLHQWINTSVHAEYNFRYIAR